MAGTIQRMQNEIGSLQQALRAKNAEIAKLNKKVSEQAAAIGLLEAKIIDMQKPTEGE